MRLLYRQFCQVEEGRRPHYSNQACLPRKAHDLKAADGVSLKLLEGSVGPVPGYETCVTVLCF